MYMNRGLEIKADQLGNNIRCHRHKLDMPMYLLARKAGLSLSLISRIETGHRSPSIKSLRKISAALHIPVTNLLDGVE